MDNNESLIINLLREGNEKALEYLFDKYFESLCQYINVYIKNKQASEELALDIFLKIWENRKEFQITSLQSYLFKSAYNKSLNFLRDEKKTISLEDLAVEIPEYEENTLEVEELDNIIQQIIMNLPDRCRTIFLSSREENLTNKEIAKKYNISIKGVESQLTKAFKIIRKKIQGLYLSIFF
jgi:RNA polymerase sigma-70 factor (ECF subfamily)